VIREADFYGVTGLVDELNKSIHQIVETAFPPINGVFLLMNNLCATPERKQDIFKKFFFNSNGIVQIKLQILNSNPLKYNTKETNYHVISKEITFSYRDEELNDNVNYVLCKWDSQWLLRTHTESTNHYVISQIFFLSLADYDSM